MTRSAFGSIRKRGARFYGRYRMEGKDYYTKTRTTKTAVRADLVRIEAAIDSGEWEPPTHKTPQSPYKTSPTLADWGLMWLEQLENNGISVGTLRSYRSSWRAHVERILGANTLLKDLDDAAVRKLVDQLKLDHSDAVRYNVMRTFSSAMNYAVERGLLESVPKIPRGATVRSRRKREPVTLNAAQLEELIDAVSPKFRAAIALGAWGALRSGEVAALRRNDFPADCSTVRVDESTKRDQDGHTVVGRPKTNSSMRTIALPENVAAIVRYHLDYYAGAGEDAFLYPSPHTDRPLADRAFRESLKAAARKAGLPERIVFHDLRHTGLTLYGRAGATTADLMARAGHSSADTVQIYQHSSAVRDRELTERMALG